MLGTRLTGEHHELLCADTLGIHVDDDLEPDFLEARQAEVRDLDRLALLFRQRDARGGESHGSPVARSVDLVSRQHPSERTPIDACPPGQCEKCDPCVSCAKGSSSSSMRSDYSATGSSS